LCPEGQAALLLPVVLPVVVLEEVLDEPEDEPLEAVVVVVLPEPESAEEPEVALVLLESAARLSVR
jgi:hypothetical protein